MKDQIFRPYIIWVGNRYRDERMLISLRHSVGESNESLKNCGGQLVFIDGKETEFFNLNFLKNLTAKIFDKEENIALFIVSSWEVKSLESIKLFFREIRTHHPDNHRVYPILVDDLEQLPPDSQDAIRYRLEKEAEGIALPCHCPSAMTTTGARRCVSLVERIMGYDIGDGSAFPDYSERMLNEIARHANRENFNENKPRVGAWEKYTFTPDNIPIIPEKLLD